MSSHSPKRQTFDVRHVTDQRVPTRNPGVSLSADLLLPIAALPVPALITMLPYRKDVFGIGTDVVYDYLACHGYAVVLVDVLGTGRSDGRRRPEFDPGEGDDAADVIRWAAAQTWCNGVIGMWGTSYGAITTFRAASLRLPQLKAIICLFHGLDPGRSTVHPDGLPGDFHAIVSRGTSMLVSDLLPALTQQPEAEDERRWRHRLDDLEPVSLDFAAHAPDDPVWKWRGIDGTSIAVPSLCLGGWRDAFTSELIEAYELISAPKHLIVGPWGHTLPHNSAHFPIDFPEVALRWWDHWLRGIDTGLNEEPPVRLFFETPSPVWRGYDRWPPPAEELLWSTRGNRELMPCLAEPPPTHIATHVSDPTHGTRRGLLGLAMGEFAGPQDQHDDDRRALTFTAQPSTNGFAIVGRPQVTVRLSERLAWPERLFTRLTHVAPDGTSTLITTGAAELDPNELTATFRCKPIACGVPAGHRLLVAVSEADFPRHNPLSSSAEFGVRQLVLQVPAIEAEGSAGRVDLPAMQAAKGAGAAAEWTIGREFLSDTVSVDIAMGSIGPETAQRQTTTTPYGLRMQHRADLHASVSRSAPQQFRMEANVTREVRFPSGVIARAAAVTRSGQHGFTITGNLWIDDRLEFERTWHWSRTDGLLMGDSAPDSVALGLSYPSAASQPASKDRE